MDHDAIAQRGSGIEDSARIDAAVVADANALANDCACFDARMCADSPTTAQGPMLTLSPSLTFAPTTADRWMPVAGIAGASSLAARANHNFGCSVSTMQLALEYGSGLPARSTTTPALLPSAFSASAESSAKATSVGQANGHELTPSTTHCGLPCTNFPPSTSISSPRFMVFSLHP